MNGAERNRMGSLLTANGVRATIVDAVLDEIEEIVEGRGDTCARQCDRVAHESRMIALAVNNAARLLADARNDGLIYLLEPKGPKGLIDPLKHLYGRQAELERQLYRLAQDASVLTSDAHRHSQT